MRLGCMREKTWEMGHRLFVKWAMTWKAVKFEIKFWETHHLAYFLDCEARRWSWFSSGWYFKHAVPIVYQRRAQLCQVYHLTILDTFFPPSNKTVLLFDPVNTFRIICTHIDKSVILTSQNKNQPHLVCDWCTILNWHLRGTFQHIVALLVSEKPHLSASPLQQSTCLDHGLSPGQTSGSDWGHCFPCEVTRGPGRSFPAP